MMVSWIKVVERKCMNSVCTLTKGSIGHPCGLDVGSEENGGIEDISWVSGMGNYID